MLWVLWRHIRWPLVNSNHQKVPDDQQNILFFIRRAERRRREAAAARGEEEVTNVDLIDILIKALSMSPEFKLRDVLLPLCLILTFNVGLLLGVFWLCPDSDINCYRLELELEPSSIIAGWQWRGEWGRRRWQWWRGGAAREDVHTIMRMCAQSWECARNHRNVHTQS